MHAEDRRATDVEVDVGRAVSDARFEQSINMNGSQFSSSRVGGDRRLLR